MSGSLPGGLGGRREANGGADEGIGGRRWLLEEKRKEKLAVERRLVLVVGGEEGELVEDVPDYWWRIMAFARSSRLKARQREGNNTEN
jgi:hypothetical protein